MEGRVGDIVHLVTRSCEGHVTGRIISESLVSSGLTSLMVQTRPREDSYREIRNPSQTLGTKREPPQSQSITSTSLLNINEELCSACVGRNDGYKGPSLRDLIKATSPRLLPYDISATTPVRATSAGTTSTLVTAVPFVLQYHAPEVAQTSNGRGHVWQLGVPPSATRTPILQRPRARRRGPGRTRA